MPRTFTPMIVLIFMILIASCAAAQTVPNPKLGETDLGAAQAEASTAGGADAELTYATRIDASSKASSIASS